MPLTLTDERSSHTPAATASPYSEVLACEEMLLGQRHAFIRFPLLPALLEQKLAYSLPARAQLCVTEELFTLHAVHLRHRPTLNAIKLLPFHLPTAHQLIT